MEPGELTVDATRCIRCGACSTLVPSVFALRDDGITVVRQPSNAIERELSRAALINCPSLAIAARG